MLISQCLISQCLEPSSFHILYSSLRKYADSVALLGSPASFLGCSLLRREQHTQKFPPPHTREPDQTHRSSQARPMAESLLLPMVRAVAGKAGDALVQSVAGMWGLDGDRGKLERQLLAVQCKLADAEVKSETNPYVKRWMKDFSTVAYEADNVLDYFQYEALRREAQIGDSKTRKVLSHLTSHSPLLFRLTMSRKLSNVLEKINKLVEEMNKFSLVENRAEAPQVLYRQTHTILDESVFGRVEDKETVVKTLLDQQEQKNVHVLPIFGMGGLGKTTLAKMVYNDPRVQQHFQLNMWHCVSENFEATAIVKSVIELATKKACKLRDTIELLRGRLQEVIGQKRYLLVLDDVWNEEERKWEDEVKPLLCSIGGPGSIIVVTCRSQKVASIMGTLGPHKLACLSEDDSWELFSKKAFSNSVEEQAELVTIGRRIVKKCRGLPLALKTMGGLMSSKQQVWEWEAIEESNIRDNVRGKDEILPILKLSYRHLTSEMKRCFAFCAVFPKDYEMQKDILIQLWMANGFLQEEVTMDLAQKGELIFDRLVWRSFLQDVKASEVSIEYNTSYNSILRTNTTYQSTVCKMHDLMHDLAKDVTDECATTEELIQQKASLKDARHIQIIQYDRNMSRSKIKKISGLFKGTTSLCTLLMTSTPYMDLKELNLMSLRALRCFGSSVTNSQVIYAKHLRYLDLSGSDFVRLPDSVSMLYSLQTLRLNDCYRLQQLPESISAMRKLIHIYLLGCSSLKQMPPNISLLNNLCTLTTFIVDTEAGRGIEELRDLRHLGNKLELYNLRKIKNVSDAKEVNLHLKPNLGELLLCWGHQRYVMPEDEVCNAEQVLESLAPHSKLQRLEVDGYVGVELSQWMSNLQMFQCLRKLIISNCPRCKDLSIVWLLASLEYLCVRKMGSLTTLCKSVEVEVEGHSSCLQFFPKLKKMKLWDLPSLDRWTENSAGEAERLVMFPVLEELVISSCPKLASVPGSPVLQNLNIRECRSLPISSLAHLTTLSKLKCDGFGSVSAIMPLHSLVKLEVSSLTNMMTVPLEDQQSQSQRRPLETPFSLSRSHLMLWECFAFVEELDIRGCDDLVRWPVEELRSLVRLRSLSIVMCEKLEGKGSSSEQTLPLPQLKTLSVNLCRSLLEIPELPASLEVLKITRCDRLVVLPSNLGDLAKLRDLAIRGCSGLKVLPDGMDGLTSLELLTIVSCRGIEEFPQSLLQRLPALKSLNIWYCHAELSRRCREGGEYFRLVSSIPDKRIPEPERGESSRKKFVRRLLPCCADSN